MIIHNKNKYIISSKIYLLIIVNIGSDRSIKWNILWATIIINNFIRILIKIYTIRLNIYL